MKLYDFEEIKNVANCVTIAKELGLALDSQGRCAAIWRNGKNKSSVSINKNGYHDFSTKESGSVIDLVALLRCGEDIQEAQEWLGDKLGLTPKMDSSKHKPKRKTRYDWLIEDGYHEVKRYDYTDPFGNVVHQVIRLEHPEKKKEFVQCDAKGRESLSGIQTVLYNLPGLSTSSWAIVVEGEKDADNLINWSLPATTNSSGSGKWNKTYTECLRDKDVVIIPDNDVVGEKHMTVVASALMGIAKSIRVCRLSKEPKADVTDWIEKEGGTKDILMQMIASAESITPNSLTDKANDVMISEAKEANRYPFKNYRLIEKKINGRDKWVKEPRRIDEMIDEIHKRFLLFPRIVGTNMFDHDRDSGSLFQITRQSTLFSWIGRKSKQKIDWARGEGFFSKEEFFEGLMAESITYESVSAVPAWPKRDDVYYTHEALPASTVDHNHFWELVDYFSPADELNRRLIAAFLMSPIFFIQGVARPAWVIDSTAGAGTGKSSLVEIAAMLFKHPPMRTNKQELKYNITDLHKRLLSTQGRNARFLLIDNIVGKFQCPELADMITAHSLSGKPSYGRGEETRPNDITYALTANSAKLDNDLADRSFNITLGKPKRMVNWAGSVQAFVHNNRMQIFSEIIDILNNHIVYPGIEPSTRVPVFETRILQAVCDGPQQYLDVLESLSRSKAESNVEEELAAEVSDAIKQRLFKMNIDCRVHDVFIRSQVLDKWLEPITHRDRNNSQIVENLAKLGMIPNVDVKVPIWPRAGFKDRRRGRAWKADDNLDKIFNATYIISFEVDKFEKSISPGFKMDQIRPVIDTDEEQYDLSCFDSVTQ